MRRAGADRGSGHSRSLRAIFEKIPFSNELKEEEIAIKRSAVALAREMVADWRAARPTLPDGLYFEDFLADVAQAAGVAGR